MFGKKDNQSNERVIYQTKPNMILGCKKAILALILLIFVLFITGLIIKFVGNMQVYMISRIQLPITRYAAIGVFVVILIIILYIILQILGWYAKDYILTDSKIIVKSGVILTRKNYMPYSTIQDINTSQSILDRLFNVGSVSVFSAYDNNQMALENISNPSKVEEIIFSNMTRNMGYYPPPQQNLNNGYRNPQQNYYPNSQQDFNNNYGNPQPNYYPDSQMDYDYQGNEDYDDVVITPIHNEPRYQPRQYEYYPENLDYNNVQRPKYEYEPYDENLEHNINRAMSGGFESYNNPQNNSYYNEEVTNDYYYDERQAPENEEVKIDSSKKDDAESSENVIKRHFDKFKK